MDDEFAWLDAVGQAALVARGIAPGRLEAIGSGEAREARTERAVDFVVLVWADR